MKPKSAATKQAEKHIDASVGKILAAIRAVPSGKVAAYGEIARRAGLPGRARMVARILSSNEDRTLPWHRILKSDGAIAFPKDSPQHREQVQKLRAEGVEVLGGKVRGIRAAATLDEILWAPTNPKSKIKLSTG